MKNLEDIYTVLNSKHSSCKSGNTLKGIDDLIYAHARKPSKTF